MNQFILVGKLLEKPNLSQSNSGNTYADFLLEVPKPYSDANGKVENEIYKITAWKNYAEDLTGLDKGEVLAVKGRLQARKYTKDDNTFYYYDMIADKISTLTSY